VNLALRAELIKLSTTRTFVALVASAVALSLLIVVLVTSLADNFTDDDLRQTFTSDASGLFIMLLGAIGMAGEWRHRTIASTVLAIPQRLRLLAAKFIAYAAAGVVLSLAVNLTIMAVGSLILSSRGEETLAFGELVDVLWRNLLVAAYYGCIGVAVGALIRNPAGAIVLLLALLFIVDGTVLALAPDVWKYGPLGGVPSAIIDVSPDGDEDLLALGLALLVGAGWLAALFAAAAATFTRRDLV
jgi:ABC-type transport system involved in multi-copper enzyme maturation permease subunit